MSPLGSKFQDYPANRTFSPKTDDMGRSELFNQVSDALYVLRTLKPNDLFTGREVADTIEAEFDHKLDADAVG
jgi:hypothetical protein